MQLTIQQVDFIEADIKKRGLKQKALRAEILDHICCAVEKEMSQGQLFHKAYLQVLQQFGENGLSELQTADRQMVQRPRFIKKAGMFSTSVAACLMLFVTTIGNAQDVPSISPLKGNAPITSGYGMRKHPILHVKKLHKGVDFKAPIGTPIIATADGVVKSVIYDKKGYGKYVIIAHGNMYETLYAQLSAFKVEQGQEVKQGDIIGLSGSSGSSTGPHLHYEIRKSGVSVNPAEYFKVTK